MELSKKNKYHQPIYEKLEHFYQSNKIPHIIFHGSSGSGKRTIVDNFILKIYQNDKKKIKTNVMMVNCAHGKGIKFIREELKFFAKTNIHLCTTPIPTKPGEVPLQTHNGIMFKTIILLNADFLTIDAQSALRRCIELFSYNTRFFIIVENKQKLLNPILSRFCEIYIPDNETSNLHRQSIETYYKIDMHDIELETITILNRLTILKSNELSHQELTRIAEDFYEKGISCLEIIDWVEKTDKIGELDKSTICICFDKIKSEYRSEKLLMLYILDLIFLRSNKEVKSILTI
jgi:DNA polymerase III delta prime subunit